MKQIRKRLTYANVMSTIAVFLILGGASALAASKLAKNSVGASQIKKNAVTTTKIKNAAVNSAKIGAGAVGNTQLGAGSVTSDKLGAGAVTGDKLAAAAVGSKNIGAGAVATANLADASVTSAKLAPAERSEVFQASSSTSVELNHPIIGKTNTSLASLTLPAGGQYAVTGESDFIFTIGETIPEISTAICTLTDDGVEIAENATTLQEGLLFPSGGVSLTGISDGGKIELGCKSFDKNVFGFKRQIIATRVG